MLSLDAPIRTDEGEALNHDVIGDSRRNSGAYYELRDCSFLFTGREATIYARYFIDQAHEQTIADELCVSPARISQVLASMKSKIKEYYISREVRERIEWDEEFGIYFVDWIQI
ncbi:MAG: hypothetical protein A2428_03010 [Bdellovibrionales bacterium RIFOXYC1_FULL_54_43]|nr:MAG: hypothetical protein A2428_03010 [Bdellovibrionales bacterium RIFOXYC1_FULL_54_43]OFZ82651.1 MAG: hypothetical protein A2603_02445 [Bdellovibrionales bacterium RIFOXYD1_FULL_55_31]